MKGVPTAQIDFPIEIGVCFISLNIKAASCSLNSDYGNNVMLNLDRYALHTKIPGLTSEVLMIANSIINFIVRNLLT